MANLNLITKGLVAHYTLDGHAKDRTPYNNHGTITGAVATTDRHGKVAGALSFNGTNDYVETNNITSSPNVTASVWFKSTKTAGNNIMHHAGAFSSLQIDWLIDTSGNELYFKVYRYTSGNVAIPAGRTDMNNGNWHHVTVTIEGTTAKIYVNGEYHNEDQVDEFVSKSYPIRLGVRAGVDAGWFNGSIDDVRIYNRALTASEIKSLYESYNSNIKL